MVDAEEKRCEKKRVADEMKAAKTKVPLVLCLTIEGRAGEERAKTDYYSRTEGSKGAGCQAKERSERTCQKTEI